MKTLNYIFKRVIIGVSIALLIYFIKGALFLNVNAAVLSHQSNGFNTTITNLDTEYNYNVNGHPFSNRKDGTVYFTVSLYKVSGDPTSPLVMLKDVNLYNDTGYFSCNVGSTSLTNSTFGGTVYSITCPVDFTGGGITMVKFRFMDNQQNSSSTSRFTFNGLFTYDSKQDINIDTSGTTNAINNQITNDNSNTQQIINSQEETTQAVEDNTQAVEDNTQAINNVKDTINDDNVNDASTEGSSFFNDFQSNDHGLSGIITSPLRLIQSISSAECNPLSFQLPFVHNNVTLPCMSSIYETHFSSFLSIYRIITTGLIGYWVVIRIFSIVKGFQDPNSSKVEVLEL